MLENLIITLNYKKDEKLKNCSLQKRANREIVNRNTLYGYLSGYPDSD